MVVSSLLYADDVKLSAMLAMQCTKTFFDASVKKCENFETDFNHTKGESLSILSQKSSLICLYLTRTEQLFNDLVYSPLALYKSEEI